MLKGILQLQCLKDHVKTTGIDQSLRNNAIYEHKCIQNMKKLCKHAGKCDDQQQFKYIIDADVVSTPEEYTDNSPISPMTSKLVNKTSARKPLCIFTNILHVKNKTATCRVWGSKSKRKAIKSGTTPWTLKPKQKGNLKINDQIKKFLYNLIMNHPQVVQSPTVNDCMKVNIDGNTEPKLISKILLQIPVQEW